MSSSRRRVTALDAVGIRQDSGQLEVLSPARRQLLATLIAAGPDGISVSAAADEIWPSGLPKTWDAAMRMGFTRLRGSLGTDAVTHQNGWCRLEQAVVDVDVWELRTLAERFATDPDSIDTMSADQLARARELAGGRPFPDVEVGPLVRTTIERVCDDQRQLITGIGGTDGGGSIDSIFAALAISPPGCWFHDPHGRNGLLDDVHRQLRSDGRTTVRLDAHPGADVAFGPVLEALPAARPIVAEHLSGDDPESVRLARTCVAVLAAFEARHDDVTVIVDHVEALDSATIELVSFLLRATAAVSFTVIARLTTDHVTTISEVAPGWPYLERVDVD